MRVVAWLTESTWEACVDAVRTTAADEVTLVYVEPVDVEEAIHGAFSGLLGRQRPSRDPGDVVHLAAREVGEDILRSGCARLDRPCRTEFRTGAVEREVVAAAVGFDLLVVARDGDRSRLGPKSLGHTTRFVVDHAPCSVMLIWPTETPGLASIPPKKPKKR
jgi:nucleotide-binding universal stress UspA family protein